MGINSGRGEEGTRGNGGKEKTAKCYQFIVIDCTQNKKLFFIKEGFGLVHGLQTFIFWSLLRKRVYGKILKVILFFLIFFLPFLHSDTDNFDFHLKGKQNLI